MVALRLVALAMGRGGDRQQGAPEAGVVDHDLLGFMTGHVFRAVSPTTQQFLLETSMLERLSGSLCAALMPETLTPGDGQALLESLYRENMFLVPGYPDRQWFSYHHLFQEFLRRALRVPLCTRGRCPGCTNEQASGMRKTATLKKLSATTMGPAILMQRYLSLQRSVRI